MSARHPAPASALVEERPHDAPDGAHLARVPRREVVGDLRDVIPAAPVEGREERGERHLQPLRDPVHCVERGRESPAFNPTDRVDREIGTLGKGLLRQFPGLAQRPHVGTETSAQADRHTASMPILSEGDGMAEMDDSHAQRERMF